jgi:hypothetical protein
MEMQKLRNEKLKIENENERLPIAIKMKSDNIDNMKHIYEESLHEKDKYEAVSFWKVCQYIQSRTFL